VPLDALLQRRSVTRAGNECRLTPLAVQLRERARWALAGDWAYVVSADNAAVGNTRIQAVTESLLALPRLVATAEHMYRRDVVVPAVGISLTDSPPLKQ
jgi:hypothetical protein